jgi:beta-ribofuranosylaminobenzene 5'-phosphate synthase
VIRIHTGSRLHFGLLSPAPEETRCDEVGHQRQFGGVGLMVEAPGIRLSVKPAAVWSAEGPHSERALRFAKRFGESLTVHSIRPHFIKIDEPVPAEHSGFGTGTQLGLAVGKALGMSENIADLSILDIAQKVGRGQRSSLGIHGFEKGGFLVEGGKRTADSVSPLLVQVAFPPEWRLVLVMPSCHQAMSGETERQAFMHLQKNTGQIDGLCRLVLLGLLPALAERDLPSFGTALHEYNARAGEAFAAVQGGRYAHAKIAEAIKFARSQGALGAGQSSWGPVVFAVVGDEDQGQFLAKGYRRHFDLNETDVTMTKARNRGAEAFLDL